MLIFESSFATLPLFEKEGKQKIPMMSFQTGSLMGALALRPGGGKGRTVHQRLLKNRQAESFTHCKSSSLIFKAFLLHGFGTWGVNY